MKWRSKRLRKLWHSYIDPLDKKIVNFMEKAGHCFERWILAFIFIWFGLPKLLGHNSATSIIAKSVYWFDPAWMVPFLGFWELLIGIFLFISTLNRVAILFLTLRLPGTFFALAYHYETCFEENVFLPTIQGQYLIKEFTLVGAALIIGGTVRREGFNKKT